LFVLKKFEKKEGNDALAGRLPPVISERRDHMRKHLALLAGAALFASASVAAAQSQTPKNYDSSGAPQSGATTQPRSGGGMTGGTTGQSNGAGGMTGAPSSSNPQAGGGAGGLTTSPHQVPENGGAPNSTAPAPR
jgi:hypothetical protein